MRLIRNLAVLGLLIGGLTLPATARADYWQTKDGYQYYWSDSDQRWYWQAGNGSWYVYQNGSWVPWGTSGQSYTYYSPGYRSYYYSPDYTYYDSGYYNYGYRPGYRYEVAPGFGVYFGDRGYYGGGGGRGWGGGWGRGRR